jgi:membrane protein YqaA with SNARE-associated domain
MIGMAVIGDIGALFGLFLMALVAGSLLPLPSEAAFVALLVGSSYPVWLLLLVATVGNVLGSVINWFLGRGIERLKGTRWFPASDASVERARAWYHRYGRWSLLLSWVPIVGDPLTIAAGVMKEPLWSFLILVTIAKFTRYAVMAAITLHWVG